MSTIGSATAAGLNLASSIVGSSRPEAAGDQSQSFAAEQNAQVDRLAQLSKTLGDVADAEFGGDRDADGRMPYRRSTSAAGRSTDSTAPSPASVPPRPASDAFGDRGNALDVEA